MKHRRWTDRVLVAAVAAALGAGVLGGGGAFAAAGPTVTLTLALAPADAAALAIQASPALDARARLARLAAAAPLPAVRTDVRRWLVAHGFAVSADNGWSITASAPAEVASAAFGATGSGTIPSALRGEVLSVLGLDNAARLTQHATLDRTPFLDGGDLRNAYVAPAGGTNQGEGTTVASVQFSGWNRKDLCTFVNSPDAPSYNRTLPKPRFVDAPALCGPSATGGVIDQRAVDGFDTQSTAATGGNGSLEVALDQEALYAVAPRANQRIYFAQNNPTGWVAAFTQMAADAEADISAGVPTITAVSVSWGMCESAYGRGTAADPLPAWEVQLERLAALGIPMFAASGDHGSYDCTGSLRGTVAVDYPASSPLVVAVGGTSLTETWPGLRDWHERAWGPAVRTTRAPAFASGGGTSARFGLPAYQSAIGATGTGRSVPDIASSADSHFGFLMFGSNWRPCGRTPAWCGAWLSAGGTSTGAPVQAGLFVSALSTFGATRPNVGSLHDLLYGNPDAVRDVRVGTGGRLLATVGFDQVTGLGTPDWQALLRDMKVASVAVPPALSTLDVPLRVIDLAHPAIEGYAAGENLAACPPSPSSPTPPTDVVLADGPDRAASIGVCVYHDGTADLLLRTVSLDRTAPTVTPSLTARSPGAVTVRTPATDGPAGSGAMTYAVRILRAFDGAVVWSNTLEKSSVTLALPAGSAYRVVASAVDRAGNAGPSATSADVVVPFDDSAFARAGGWRRFADTASYGGGFLRSTARGDSLSVTFRGSSAALLAHTNPDAGAVRIYVDGRYVRFASLYARTGHRSVRIPIATWAGRGQHVVRIVTSSAKPVRIDGIAVA